MKYILLVVCLLFSLTASAQRIRTIEHLLRIDTTQVVVRSANLDNAPGKLMPIPRDGVDTIVRRRYFQPDHTWDIFRDRLPLSDYHKIQFDSQTNTFLLFPAYRAFVPKRAHFAFNSNLSLGWVNRLPERQNKFGQNAPPYDLFSWGEPITESHNPYNFFRSSLGATNQLDYFTHLGRGQNALLNLRYVNVFNRGIVPESGAITNDFSAEINNMQLRFLPNAQLGLRANYLFAQNRLIENGNNHTRLFYNVATTPPNVNNNQSEYIANMFDEESRRRAAVVFTMNNLNLPIIRGNFNWEVSYNHNLQRIQSDILPYEIANRREETIGSFNSRLQYTRSLFNRRDFLWQIRPSLSIAHNFSSTNYDAYFTNAENVSLRRITNDLGVSINNNRMRQHSSWRNLFIYNFWLNASTSNTLNNENMFLNKGLNVEFQIWETPWRFLRVIRPYYSLSRTQSEAPLFYRQPHYASTLTSVENFRNFQEQFPLFHNPNLALESAIRQEIGLAFDIDENRWRSHRFDISYFWNRTSNGIVPVHQGNRFELTNAIDWDKGGLEITYRVNGFIWLRRHNDINWQADLNFTSYRATVRRILTGDDRIALAGFSDVSLSALAGERYGVIFGQRTDGTMGVIGDPTPDFTLNLNLNFNWNSWELALSMGYVHGGDVWNGTRNAMNYFGTSAESAKNRIAQSPSESPYFADGIAGIAQNAIEDASTLRFHNISLSYDFSHMVDFPELRLSLGINNLILWSAYSGVDPARPLFGYTAARGLDFFNMPSTTSVVLALSMKF